jgi:hypothetical protein
VSVQIIGLDGITRIRINLLNDKTNYIMVDVKNYDTYPSSIIHPYLNRFVYNSDCEEIPFYWRKYLRSIIRVH